MNLSYIYIHYKDIKFYRNQFRINILKKYFDDTIYFYVSSHYHIIKLFCINTF